MGSVNVRASLQETAAIARGRFLFAVLLFVLLMALALGGAELKGRLDADWAERLKTEGVGAGTTRVLHTTMYYRVIYTIWVATILLTAALCFYIMLRPGGPNSYWKAFWTCAFLAYLAHFCFAYFGLFQGNWEEMFHSQAGIAKDPEKTLEQPIPDLILLGWWALDVLLLWMGATSGRLINIERGLLHLVAFVMFFGATVLAVKAGMVVRFLGIVMALSVGFWLLVRILSREPDPDSFMHRVWVGSFTLLNRFAIWYKLPTWIGLLNLGTLRDTLRAQNLHNTSDIPVTNEGGLRPDAPRKGEPMPAQYLYQRQEDGFWNDLEKPTMGCASVSDDPLNSSDFTRSHPGARFGRNIPLSEVDPTRDGPLMEPSPRLISNQLLARKPVTPDGDFARAGILNLLAAAWIQFQTHDWFNHGNPVKGNELEVPVDKDDPWPQKPMKVRRTRPDPTRDPSKPEDKKYPTTYANAESHWWDSSQIYGSSTKASRQLRSGQKGKVVVEKETGLVPIDHEGLETTGLTSNWWLGLSLLHNLFIAEHNAICDYLAGYYPTWDDDQLYRTARMCNAALIAKIHTVDWTTAILAQPTLQLAMNANWWGAAGEHIKKAFGRISESEGISGIVGSATNHHTGDYCLTEEFVSVYRMHPLMPDDIKVWSVQDGKPLRTLKLGAEDDNDPDEATGPNARANALRGDTVKMKDLFYSFGVQSPGALQLHNFPNWMRRLRRRNGKTIEETIDLATIDVMRDRERGVPRYNRFRELFHLPRVCSFEELAAKPEWAKELREIYKDVDKVDLMVGLYAEKPPEGFGFSDTAFRVFILMASRRLKSDRFFTRDWTPDVYTSEGMAWVENNNMTTVLLRHYPELTASMQGVSNPFAPWTPLEKLPAGPKK
jgi:hypothetical protein